MIVYAIGQYLQAVTDVVQTTPFGVEYITCLEILKTSQDDINIDILQEVVCCNNNHPFVFTYLWFDNDLQNIQNNNRIKWKEEKFYNNILYLNKSQHLRDYPSHDYSDYKYLAMER